MNKKETIKEIRRFPNLYFDALIRALNRQGNSKETLQIWVKIALEGKK